MLSPCMRNNNKKKELSDTRPGKAFLSALLMDAFESISQGFIVGLRAVVHGREGISE